jgi:hypothetical protein
MRRARERAPNLTLSDRLLCGFGSLFISPGRIRKVAIGVRPPTLLAFHQAVVRRRYRRPFSSSPCSRFHGVLAPNAKLRREIVPSPPEQATAPACDHAQGAPARLSWARLLKRVFDIDIEHCPNCGGSLKIIACPEPRRRAAIEDPPVIVKILAHLGLPTRAPPRSPAQRFDLFQTI